MRLSSKSAVLTLVIPMVLAAGTAAAKPGAGQYFEVNGLRMYYEVQGQGRPLVLLHGGMVTIESSFAKIRPVFNKGWKTIAIEQQAHGHTNDVKDRPLSTEQMAEDTHALLTSLGIKDADFFGWSMGGAIAVHIALKHPEMVHKLVISGTAFHPDGQLPEMKKMMAGLTPEVFPPAWRQEYEKKNPDPKGFPNLVAKIKQMATGEWKGMKPEEIKAIQAPVLFMLGDADIVRPEHAVEMFRLLPHAKLAVLPMTDHFAPVQRHEWVVSMVKAFLEAPMPGAAPKPGAK